MSRLRVVLIGYGAINQKVVQLLKEANAPVDIVGVGLRETHEMKVPLPEGACAIYSPDELALLSADLVLEAAGREALIQWWEASLEHAGALAIASTSALADDALMARLVAKAKAHKRQILIPPGALAGVDALAAAGLMDLSRVHHTIIKPAKAWAGTKAETLCDLHHLVEPKVFFEGTAREAARTFPQNANVTVISSLAGVGLELTHVQLIADPNAQFNAHKIEAEGAFGRMKIEVENFPFPENPKTSLLTALSLVRLVKNRAATLVV